MHEKVDHLPPQSLKHKETSGTVNHLLNKNNELNYLFHRNVFPFTDRLHVIFNKTFYLRIFDGYFFQISSIKPFISGYLMDTFFKTFSVTLSFLPMSFL